MAFNNIILLFDNNNIWFNGLQWRSKQISSLYASVQCMRLNAVITLLPQTLFFFIFLEIFSGVAI
jgi:hypothetical protein